MSSEKLKNTGLKVTPSRLTIFTLLENHQDTHLTAYDIQQLLHNDNSDISLATIYRVLGQFEEAGLIERHEFDDDKAVYELSDGAHHDHMICNSCSKVFDLTANDIKTVYQDIAEQHGFDVVSHRLTLYGTCSNCSYTSSHKD